MAKPQAEQSVFWLGSFTALTFIVAIFATVMAPSANPHLNHNSPDEDHFHQSWQEGPKGRLVRVSSINIDDSKPVYGYNELQERGRLVYQREGCMYCHTQQIRPLDSEMLRYRVGNSVAPASDEREYIYDIPHFLGTKRNGPDLSRVGGKYSDDWQYSHLYNPPQMVPGSIMPAFIWLFTNKNPADPSYIPVPNEDAVALVAYLQTLGAGRQVWDQTLNSGKGGWRPWISLKDAITSETFSENMVHSAATPVFVPNGQKASSPILNQ
jgi:cbb3-type cytochrome oxidase cytochrome c subunit